jgi:hypothetical protein
VLFSLPKARNFWRNSDPAWLSATCVGAGAWLDTKPDLGPLPSSHVLAKEFVVSRELSAVGSAEKSVGVAGN